MQNQLHHGDNLAVVRGGVAEGTVDLCYVDTPFCSGRDYGPAFTDTWTWDDTATREYAEIVAALDQPEARAHAR